MEITYEAEKRALIPKTRGLDFEDMFSPERRSISRTTAKTMAKSDGKRSAC